MHHHRFSGQATAAGRLEESGSAARGFVFCPLALQQGWQGQGCPWQEVYQLAYAQARAVVRPSVMERFQAHYEN